MLIKAIAIILLLSPFSATADDWNTLDKKGHAIVSALITEVAYQATGSAEKAFYIAMAVGVAKELLDSTRPRNSFSWKDITADAGGSGVVYLVHFEF